MDIIRRKLLADGAKIFAGASIASLLFSLGGCVYRSIAKRLDGELSDILSDFSVYNGRNPNLFAKVTVGKTWRESAVSYGDGHSGIIYTNSRSLEFVAPAPGVVVSSGSRTGSGGSYSKASGDVAVIQHGNGVWSELYHMEERSCKVRIGDEVKRGDVLGHGGAPYGMRMKYIFHRDLSAFAYFAASRNDPENNGHRHGFMQWDDGSNREFSTDEVEKRARNQELLILKFMNLYDGPGYKDLVKQMVHVSNRTYKPSWSPVEKFKLMEHIFKKRPDYFSDKPEQVQQLIDEVYDQQPVILTLPFKK